MHRRTARANLERIASGRDFRNMCTLRRFAILGAVLLSSIKPAHAQGLALSRFEPAERGSRFFVADSLELRHSVDGVARPFLVVGMPVSYAARARTFGSASEGEQSHLSNVALYLHPGASVVLSPGARFALDVPIAGYQQGEDTNLAGTYYLAPRSPVLGDVRAAFDLRLFGPASRDADGVALAAGVRAWLPTGGAVDYAGEDATRFGVQLTSAVRESFVLATARVAYMYRREGTFGGSPIASEMTTAVGVAYANAAWTIGPELFGATLIDRFFKTKSTPIEVLLGAHRSYEGFRFGAGVGTSIVSGLGAAHVRALLSVEWAPIASASVITDTQSDRDRDGVIDLDDMCPDVPGPRDAVAKGCPSAPSDQDGDGIFDPDDACPAKRGLRSRDPRTHGCPDTDGDGILDPLDACVDAAGDESPVPSQNGCPPAPPPAPEAPPPPPPSDAP